MWMRSIWKLAAFLVFATPLAALADGEGPIQEPLITEAPAPTAEARAECEGDAPIAQVASLLGDVRAIAPDGSARALECDDVVRTCEAVVTAGDATVTLLVEDAIVQVGPQARAELSARPGPELAVEQGGVRVVDARDQAAQRIQLFTPALTASTSRGDAEIVREGESVRICARDEAVVVTARDGAQTVPAGSCLETKVLGGMVASRAGEPAIPLGDPGACPFYVAAVPGVLPPVGAPAAGPDVPPFEPPGRDSCDTPGSGCAAVREIFEDPDPGTGCGFPGSPCNGE
jgi:hypothetical protein